MQPPLVSPPNERRTSHLDIRRHLSTSDANLEPTPTRPRPQFEQDARLCAIFPLTCIERGGLVPPARRDGRTFGEFFPLSLSFLFLGPPRSPLGREGTCRPKGGMNSCTAKHGRHMLCYLCQRHDGCRVLFCGMGESFQCGECLLVREV